MQGTSTLVFAVMVLASAALCGCRFELNECSFDSDCVDYGCPDGEEPFCEFEGDELLGSCACRAVEAVE